MNELARTYESVFAGPPWNEYKKCTGDACKKSFGLETKGQDLCPCPNEAMLAPFYPRTETLASIAKEVDRPGALVVEKRSDSNELIGFAWGFPTTVSEFLDEKYKTIEGRRAVIKALYENGINDKIFYFSETGIRQEARGQGMSNQFAEVMVDEAQRLKLPLVMRTNWQSPMVAVAGKFNMEQILGPETFALSGAIYQTGKIKSSFDPENRSRVLYVSTSVPRA